MVAPDSSRTYRLGDAFLRITSEHRPFPERFHRLFAGCEAPPTASDLIVDCTVTCPRGGGESRIALDPSREWDRITAARDLFGDRGWHLSASEPAEHASLQDAAGSVMLDEVDGVLVARNDQPWEWIVGNLALHRVLMLQPDLAVFHGASVAIAGCGVMILGPKGAGKTTVSLALAARGHSFLGDETAAVRLRSRELVPFRRSLSVRGGPTSTSVRNVLAETGLATETFPDGTVRTRIDIERLFPLNTAAPVSLSAVVFLGPREAQAELREVRPSREHFAQLGVLRSTMWEAPPAVRVMRLAGMLRATQCFVLHQSDPDSTADALERGVLRSCH